MTTPVKIPEIDDNVREVTIVRWLKKAGQTVAQHDPLVEIETDKVTMEISAEATGRLQEIVAEEGQTVQVGAILAYIREEAATGREQPAARPEAIAPGQAEPPSEYTGPLTPVVRRIAAEEEIDLNQVEGTGRGGRITKKDLLAYLESRREEPEPPAKTTPAQAEPPSPAVAEAPADEVVPLTAIRRRIAEHMVRSKQTSPHVTTVFEVDFAAVARHLADHKVPFAQDGVKLTYTAYIIEATVQALKKYPTVNSRWSDDGIVLKREINIGVATATDAGLLVPVIKQADRLNLLGLARTLNDLAQRARSQQLQPGEVQGGTFTLTNHGMGGSLLATPIIHQPQCGILGLGVIQKRVKVIEGDAIAIRPCAYVTFTFDHRILDGATADAFVRTIKETLEGI